MKLFSGVYTALATPFLNGKVDFESIGRVVDHQLAAGIAGLVINGTTGESPTITTEESFEIFKFVREKTQGKMKLVYGSGSNSTAKTTELSQKAEKIGADGLLVVVPYYNKPTQRGLYEHYKAVAESVNTPVMLYNVPGRTITSLTVETIRALMSVKNIVAIKEATGNLEFGREIIGGAPGGFVVSSGDDESCLELKKFGGQGVVSVCSHVMPKRMVEWFSGEVTEAKLADFAEAKPLISSLYISSNPIPVKAALKEMGLIRTAEMRLPLTALESEQLKVLQEQMKKYERFIG